MPVDTNTFYQLVINWLEMYLKHSGIITVLVFQLDYFNSASYEVFIYIINLFDKAFQAGHNISVEWHYAVDDTDIFKAGLSLASLVKVPFVYKVIPG